MKSFHSNKGRYINPYRQGTDQFNNFERGWTQALKRCPNETLRKYNSEAKDINSEDFIDPDTKFERVDAPIQRSSQQLTDVESVNISDFSLEKECIYEGERYSVRDNGAVFRHKPEGKRARPNDERWTFGKRNSANPYLHISGTRVHRIVATAFHGNPPDPKYVVDHIDTNCRNNRPENLRWLSRLENALKNPVTRKKIEYLCGSIEAFLDNPSILHELQTQPNFKWMRTVTPEEAQNCKMRMSIWANTEIRKSKPSLSTSQNESFEQRVYKPLQKWEVGLDGEPGLDFAETPWCATYMWRGNVEFPCCPQGYGHDPLDDYFLNIKTGAVFANLTFDLNNESDLKLTVADSLLLKERSSILVMTKWPDAKWSIVGVQLHSRSNHFIHFILGTYSNKKEAIREFSTKAISVDFWSEGYSGAYRLWP